MLLADHEDRHICFAEANWGDGAEGTNSADGTGLFFEGRATQVGVYLLFIPFFSVSKRRYTNTMYWSG